MEKIVTVITIGLIELIAALNILIVLVMMVMEKRRDIAVLMSMGARSGQIRRIFITQGVLIGLARDSDRPDPGLHALLLREPRINGSASMSKSIRLASCPLNRGRSMASGWRRSRWLSASSPPFTRLTTRPRSAPRRFCGMSR